jgi:hypothetical protein
MLTIKRWYHNDCTIGRLTLPGGAFQCFTLELPWKENERGVSCIPKGKYQAFKRQSPKNGSAVEFLSVPQRSNIQIHAGNYTRQIEGCILVGASVAFLDSDSIPDVANSKVTLDKLMALLPDKFEVEIL